IHALLSGRTAGPPSHPARQRVRRRGVDRRRAVAAGAVGCASIWLLAGAPDDVIACATRREPEQAREEEIAQKIRHGEILQETPAPTRISARGRLATVDTPVTCSRSSRSQPMTDAFSQYSTSPAPHPSRPPACRPGSKSVALPFVAKPVPAIERKPATASAVTSAQSLPRTTR